MIDWNEVSSKVLLLPAAFLRAFFWSVAISVSVDRSGPVGKVFFSPGSEYDVAWRFRPLK